MSISVSNISKNYDKQKALDDVSFEVPDAQILGFLGPNGAGKSTMMKIITTFIPPDSGSVKVNGFDIISQSMDVRRTVGYLPEHNPLYLEMYVREYLGFIAGLHKLKNPDLRVKEMIGKTGLTTEQHKKIGALSKGYRQRVGLAQAMIHDPKVLILDEPTSGLDPNQLTEIRNLIKEIGREKTVMFSTHIMQEVEALCDRIIIISNGKIVADANAGELNKDAGDYSIHVEFDQETSRGKLSGISGVKRVEKTADHAWELFPEGSADIRPAVFKFAVDNGLTVLTISKSEKGLEEIFQKLTAKR